jgi:hypothetical protein
MLKGVSIRNLDAEGSLYKDLFLLGGHACEWPHSLLFLPPLHPAVHDRRACWSLSHCGTRIRQWDASSWRAFCAQDRVFTMWVMGEKEYLVWWWDGKETCIDCTCYMWSVCSYMWVGLNVKFGKKMTRL